MKGKRVLSGLLIAGLILSNGVSVFAAPELVVETSVQAGVDPKMVKIPQISEEKARDLAKEYVNEFFKIDIDKEKFEARANNRQYVGLVPESTVWYLSFYQYKKDANLNIDVTINGDDGKLISISKWDHNMLGENQVSKFTKEEAQKTAQDFLEKHHSNLLSQLKLDERYNTNYYPTDQGLRPTNYVFNYLRHEDGVPVLYDGVNIGVNSGTGELSSYTFTWTNEKLPEKKNIISKEKAQEIFEKSFDMNLTYIPVRDITSPYYDEIKEVKLAYSPNYAPNGLIDAYTGKNIDYSGIIQAEIKKIDLTDAQKLEVAKLTKNNNVVKKEMTREEAKKETEKLLKEIYNENVQIIDISYNSNTGGNNKAYKSWEARFKFEDSVTSEGYISLNATTGEVMNLNNYNWQMRDRIARGEEKLEHGITWENAYHKAIEVLKELYPDKLKSTVTGQQYSESYTYYNDEKIKDLEYYFNFQREENGIVFNNNYLTVSFDSFTGRLQSLYMNWDNIELPKAEGIIDKEKAKTVFLKESNVGLSYSYIYPMGLANDAKPEIKLVYSNQPKGDLVYFNLLDAKTGVLMDWSGQLKTSEDSKKDLIEKISSHWAYKELKIMVERNIINLESISLEDKVTRKQALKMMTIAKGNMYYGGGELEQLKFTDIDRDDPDYRYLQLAVDHRLIDNVEKPLNGDQYITREELAELLIKVVGLDKIAKIQGIYNIPVSDKADISKERFGYVALAYGLEIIKGRGQVYLPKEEVDLVQVAVSIYRVMEAMGNYSN